MTLLSVVQQVSEVVGVASTNSVFANLNGNRTNQEMLALANEMAQRIAYDTRDWTLFQSMCFLTTGTSSPDGRTTTFAMPADFKRMLLTTNLWRSTSNLSPMLFMPDPDKWLNRRNRKIYSGYGEWHMIGGKLEIAPMLGTGQTISFTYLTKNCINLASGGMGDSFMSDGDTFALDERVLKLGMIWQWKAQKGAPYAEDMGTYADALSIAMGHDSPAPIIIGRQNISSAMQTTYPFPFGLP